MAVFFLHTFFAFAQLPAFTLNIAKTDETCPGNGTLTFSTQGADPSATVTYSVYELPDTTNAIAVQTTPTISGLVHGDYRVIATQTLGNQSNTQQQEIYIDNHLVLLAYTISSTAVTCNDNGTMTAAVFQGTGVMYEIISGPVIRAPQSSATFTSLPAGQYEVRVIDNCGEGWVATHTVFYDNTFSVATLAPDNQQLVSCNSTTIVQTITAPLGDTLNYPITVAYTFNPPGGGPPQTVTSTVNSGDPLNIRIETVLPYYNAQDYSYSLVITDACGKVYNVASVPLSGHFSGSVVKAPAKCGKYFLTYNFSNFMPPLNLNFLTVPAGFNPAAFNTNYPNPFTASPIAFGDTNNPVPFGIYTAEVSDGCGRSVTLTINLEEIPIIPNVTPLPNQGCDSGRSEVTIKVPNIKIASASITVAPATFSTIFPVDMSAYINTQGNLVMPNLPAGDYKITLVDECGNSYYVEFTVQPLATDITLSPRPGCEYGKGSVRIRGVGTDVVSAVVKSGPPEFMQSVPYDASFNITSNGIFSMNGFPPGSYVFVILDNCGVEHTRTVTVTGYEVTNNTFDIVEHCGSFDLTFSHMSNADVGLQFYLQKYNPGTGNWGHPQTNFPYTEGTPPSTGNSYPLTNNTTNYNISYLGDFRIIKRFESYENGNIGEFKDCVEVIQNFTFINSIRITDIKKTTCSGQISTVTVTAAGVNPLTYQITTKDGQPFFINNGNNNVFPNLDPAVYNFLVFDPCGDIGNRIVDVSALPSAVTMHQPGNLVACDGADHDLKADFDLSSLNATVLGNQPASDYTVTYHATIADATNDSNALPSTYNSTSKTIFVRLEYNGPGNCFETASFQIIVNPTPELHIEKTEVICEGKSITLSADAGYPSYHWSTGETTPTIVVDAAGSYTVEVSDTRLGVTCAASETIEVKASGSPSIQQIVTSDFTTNDNVITVILSNPGLGHYMYSLDNIHFQESNTFNGLPAGGYTVYIKDENGCEPVDEPVFLLTYPKFFTPNADGYNDFWQIKFSFAEPEMKVYIFDRYGKLITGFKGDSLGWDGRYNNADLPSTDYWFLVIRPNGKEYRGHFTMKR